MDGRMLWSWMVGIYLHDTIYPCLVCRFNQTLVDATGLDFWTCLVRVVSHDGHSSVARLAAGWALRGGGTHHAVYVAAFAECCLVDSLLWAPASRGGFLGNPHPLVRHFCDINRLLASIARCRLPPPTLSDLGGLCGSFELRHMANEY